MAAAELRRGRGPGPRHGAAAQRDPERPRPARLLLYRPARRRQDDARAHPGALPELREGSHRDALRRLPLLRRDRRGPLDRRPGDRRREPHRRRRRARADRVGALRAVARQAPDLHRGRSPHALDAGLQRAAQDARGAAAAQPLRLRDDESGEDPVHGPLALPALRPAPHRALDGDASGWPRSAGPRASTISPARLRDRARGRGLDARRADAARSGAWPTGGQQVDDARRRGDPRPRRPPPAERDRRRRASTAIRAARARSAARARDRRRHRSGPPRRGAARAAARPRRSCGSRRDAEGLVEGTDAERDELARSSRARCEPARLRRMFRALRARERRSVLRAEAVGGARDGRRPARHDAGRRRRRDAARAPRSARAPTRGLGARADPGPAATATGRRRRPGGSRARQRGPRDAPRRAAPDAGRRGARREQRSRRRIRSAREPAARRRPPQPPRRSPSPRRMLEPPSATRASSTLGGAARRRSTLAATAARDRLSRFASATAGCVAALEGGASSTLRTAGRLRLAVSTSFDAERVSRAPRRPRVACEGFFGAADADRGRASRRSDRGPAAASRARRSRRRRQRGA